MSIGNYPYLEYTIVPSPLILNQKQDIIIIATLKTKAENQGTLKSVTVDNIVIDFGAAGSGATDLTSSANVITNNQLQQDTNWKITQGGGGANSLTVKPQPNHSGQVKTNAIFIKVTGVKVNDTKGNVNVTITETVGKVDGKKVKGNSSIEPVNQTSLIIPKIKGAGTATTTFTASHHSINTQNQPNVVLSWNGPAGPDYSLHYLYQDQLINVPPEGKGGSEGTLGSNGSYTLYPASTPRITPSNTQHYMPEETTDFILRIKADHAPPTYQTLTIVVENSHLICERLTTDFLTIGDPSWSDLGPCGLKVDGQMRIGDSDDNGVIYTPSKSEGGLYFRKGSPGDHGDLGNFDNDGNLSVTGTVSGANLKATGTISGSNLEATAEGSTVTGDLTVDGSIYAPLASHMTDVNTWRDCFGFGHECATWLSGQQASTGGETIAGIEGFSVTNGTWNYGVYELNIGAKRNGYVKVDMYMANYESTGNGIWNIYSTDHQIKSLDGKYGYDLESSYMLWSSELSPAYAPTKKGGGRVVRSKVCVYFEGQYIYIGCQDTGGGQVGLKINSVEVIHAVGLQ